MNNPNPFVPKGSLLEQQSQRRSRLKIAVFCVLAVCVTGLVAMLIQGCKRENPDTNPPPDTNNTPAVDTNLPAIDTNAPPMGTNAAAAPAPMAPPPVVQPPVVEPTPAPGATYEVVSGDTLAKIAKKSGVTLKALEAANPGVDPKKLKPKQKLNLPAATAAGAATSAPTAAASTGDMSGGGKSYTVKSGDTLSKIAKHNHVTLHALRSANSLTTDHIKVGQKLTIPGTAETAAPAATAEASAPAVLPPTAAPAPAPAPATPAPAPAPGH
jgi:LysM repeat protein